MRGRLAMAQAEAWRRIGEPGSWWTGAERIAIAAETRHAAGCRLCAARRDALSPAALAGEHDAATLLPATAVEAIHRIRTDSGRLGETWYRDLLAAGLSDTRYVELVSVLAVVVAIDTFRTALGLDPWPLPPPVAGEPARRRPAGAKPGVAWMPTLAPDDRAADDPDLYGDDPGPRRRTGANVHQALSLVPSAMIHWWDAFETMYMSSAEMRDFSREFRAIGHGQMEMLAARVAALNRCEY